MQVGRQFEVEIATAEMERAQQRLMTLEREKEDLVAKVSNMLTQSSGVLQVQAQCCATATCFWPMLATNSCVSQIGEGKDSPTSGSPVSRQNEEGLRAELSSQRQLVSRLHSEMSSSKCFPPF